MKKGLSKKNKKGFTLIELVVVIAILGILAAILIPVIAGFIERANVASEQANARNLFNSVAILLATNEDVETNLGNYIDLTGYTANTSQTGTIGEKTYAYGTSGTGTNTVVEWARVGGSTYYKSGSYS